MQTKQINGLDVSLIDGCLHVSREGTLTLKTKGNPQLVDNPPFATIEDAVSYFELLGLHLPVETILPEPEEVPASEVAAPLDSNDPAITASTLS